MALSARHVILVLYVLSALLNGTNASSNNTIRIAWLAPEKLYYYFNASTSLGALAFALNTITEDPKLLPGYTFDVRWEDSDCNSKSGIGAIFNIMTSSFDPHLILGPVCSPAMDPVAQLGSLHNLPVFGWISSDPTLSDKTKYTTLVRLLGPLTATGEGMIILLKHFIWRRVFLVSTAGPDYGELGKGIRNAIKRNEHNGYQIARWEQDVPEGVSRSGIKDIYENIKNEARIVILCVPLGELRTWMLAAYDSRMTDGEYVFIYANQIVPTEKDIANFASPSFYSSGDGRDDDARQAFGNLIMIFQKTLESSKTNEFLSKFENASYTGNWSTMTKVPPAKPDVYSLFLHDALILYAELATQVGTINNGTAIFKAAENALITGGATGTILMSETADRYPDYWIMDMDANGNFDLVGSTVSSRNGLNIERIVKIEKPIIWGDGSVGLENRPKDVPECGFRNEYCNNFAVMLGVPLSVSLVFIIIAAILFILYRKWAREKELNNMYWKIPHEELQMYRGKRGFGSQSFVSLSRTRLDAGSLTESVRGQLFVQVATYHGHLVAVKDIKKTKFKIDRKVLEEFRLMTQLKHNNLLTFIGACVDDPNICSVWDYCSKGSLQDVIWNENITLDDMFKFSIALDVAKGLSYIHGSQLKMHGRFKSSNVVIDGRWVCKLADYGLPSLISGQDPGPDSNEHVIFSRLMWTAPELLRESSQGEIQTESQPADIYALGIILKETFCRNGPYTEYEDLTPIEIIDKVKEVPPSGVPFRPDLQESAAPPGLNDLIVQCWEEDSKERPTIQQVLRKLSRVNPFKKANVMDNMISMMEKYSNHLEEIVADRTMALEEEKKKTENLLYRMLPRSIAEDLKHGKPIAAESFDSVTIYFSDIVKFTDLAAESTPLQVVNLLNDLYTLFDSTIANHDVYKVETIGDAYMLVSGLPVRNGDRHVVEIVNCSMDLLSGVLNFRVPHKPDYKLNIRIGVHTGSCVAGVVGLTMPRYCLFGDTVNTTSRMESNGLPLRIHLSQSSETALSAFGGYKLAARGGIEVKGKGNMETYWLVGHEEFDSPLPDFNKLKALDNPQPTCLPVTRGKPWKVQHTKVTSPDSTQTDNTSNSVPTLPEKPKQEHKSKRKKKVSVLDPHDTESVHGNTEPQRETSNGGIALNIVNVAPHDQEEGTPKGKRSVRLPPLGDATSADVQREGTIHNPKLPDIMTPPNVVNNY